MSRVRGRRLVVAVAMTRGLFAASAAVWLVFALLVATGSSDVGPVASGVAAFIAALMLLAAVVLGLLAWRVLRGNRLLDGVAVIVAVANVALTLTDDVGSYDIAYLVLSIALLTSLLLALGLLQKAGTAV